MTRKTRKHWYTIVVFVVDKWAFETNSSVPPLTKTLVTIDEVQEGFLSGRMKTTATSINETWVQRLTNNVVFQIRWTIDARPSKFPYYRIIQLFWKTLLL